VGETIAPSVNAPAQESPDTAACAITATLPIVAPTSPTESRLIGRRFAFRSRRPVKKADE